jgi:hypothetical protein
MFVGTALPSATRPVKRSRPRRTGPRARRGRAGHCFGELTNVRATHSDRDRTSPEPSGGIIGAAVWRPTLGRFRVGLWRAPLSSAWATRGELRRRRFILGSVGFGSDRVSCDGSVRPGSSLISQYNVSSPDSSRSHTNREDLTPNQDWRGMPSIYHDIGWASCRRSPRRITSS